MKNYVQLGDNVTLPAPYAVASGGGALIGSIFGVASADAAPGADVSFCRVGAFTLAKAAGTAWTVGVKLYWDTPVVLQHDAELLARVVLPLAVALVGVSAGVVVPLDNLSGSSPIAPIPLAISDFKKGEYSIGGVAKTLFDLWVGKDEFDPWTGSNVIPGTGMVNTSTGQSGVEFPSPIVLPAVFDPSNMDEGITAVIHSKWDFVPSESGWGYIFRQELFANDDVDYSNRYNAQLNVTANEADRSIQFTAGSYGDTQILDLTAGNVFHSAVSMKTGSILNSVNGNVSAEVAAEAISATSFGLNLSRTTSYKGTFTHTIERIEFYPVQSAASLQALSTLV
ncbi:DUF2190 family protein (plasmid) [Sphingomonas paeninsulae]|uniref:DUF2190 family protein n=1 Tax=Sphingomonas paeninsulae TaxID=2319844 RepID=A0A494TJK8_SPHPE|nr:DUF2190 family protein [Sphingomonas paeninsulae]AYJ85315.1 DUF2190 family protein [Sphingomonas paeninsulae]